MKEASYYKKLKDDVVQCVLCPNYCSLEMGEYGSCRARKNVDGKLMSLSYGKAISIGVDPIEKKPLYHFLPGERVFSFGTAGCNLHCGWCQNWRISQAGPDESPINSKTEPREIVERAVASGCKLIAYTYTEPTVFYEYVLETAKIARRRGIKNVIVSNGYINPVPLEALIRHIDAANIDLKSISDEVYKEYCGARLGPILETIEALHKSKIWLELTYLLIPGINTSDAQIGRAVEWVKSVCGDAVPLHFSAFYPCYKMANVERTPVAVVRRARALAREAGLKYVYVGNVLDVEGSATYCPSCGELVISRVGYAVESFLKDGKCECGARVEGVWK